MRGLATGASLDDTPHKSGEKARLVVRRTTAGPCRESEVAPSTDCEPPDLREVTLCLIGPRRSNNGGKLTEN